MAVAEWLTWRREIAGAHKLHLQTISQTLARLRSEVQHKGGKVVGAAVAVNEAPGPNDPPNLIVNVDEKQLIQDIEKAEETLGTLDGKLSLFNATRWLS
jgi:hypothetical protein